jgi:hypothetical protein
MTARPERRTAWPCRSLSFKSKPEPGQGRGRGRGGRGRGADRGQGGGNRPTSGPGGSCVCPKCGHKEVHVAGQRCLDRACPECGTKMVRE